MLEIMAAVNKKNDKYKNIIALIIGLFFAIGVSEVVLQILDIPPRPVSGWLYCKTRNTDECNYLGFRGRKIFYSPDDFVVILLGDSEVVTSFPFEEMPEHRLEHFLRKYNDSVKVFSVAAPGYGQDQQYLALMKYFEKHRADLVLQMFTARNDNFNSLLPVSGANDTVKPTFWLEDGKLRGPTEGWLEPVGPRIKLSLLWQKYLGKSLGEIRKKLWEERLTPYLYQPMAQYHGEVDYSWQDVLTPQPQKVFEAKIDKEMSLTPRSKLQAYNIALMRSLFSKIKEITEENNGRFVIFKEERPWELETEDKVKVSYLFGEYYKTSLKQYKENLDDLFRGFEHYRIPLNLDNVTMSHEDVHLSQEAVDNLFKELSFELN
jgi:hypothetical protein